MPAWTFLRLFADDDGVTRVDTNFTQPLATADFAPPATLAAFGREVIGPLCG